MMMIIINTAVLLTWAASSRSVPVSVQLARAGSIAGRSHCTWPPSAAIGMRDSDADGRRPSITSLIGHVCLLGVALRAARGQRYADL